jgi:hypothetical protein
LFLICDWELVLGIFLDLEFVNWSLERYALCSMPFQRLFSASVSSFSTSGSLSLIPLIEYPGRTLSHLHLPKGY